MDDNKPTAFDALLTPEQRQQLMEDLAKREQRPIIEVARVGSFADQVLQGASQRLMFIANAADSETLGKLAAMLTILASGKFRLPDNCEHMKDNEMYPNNVLFMCSNCFRDDTKYPIHLPVPIVIRITADEKFADGVEAYEWMGGNYGTLFIPKRLGMSDTWTSIIMKLNEWKSEKEMLDDLGKLDMLSHADNARGN